ncbi:hypothetical protein AB0A69_04060 [Streptomyces sp. NPDC045431]|uniref:hypothetical protein n=1 Tax=Streptomyces sp. NPDC045431 TaxID=3155613 RepID=UPI0033C97788
MTTAEGWATTVRSRLSLGRLLPLGGLADGTWLAERAADGVLRGAARRVPGVSPGRLRIDLAEPDAAPGPVSPFPRPPGALPPGPLRLSADFAATGGVGVPLPELAAGLRTALFAACEERLGLVVTEVDLRVTALLDGPAPAPEAEPSAAPGEEAGAVDLSDPVAAAAAAVPGVRRLTTVLGPSVHRAADHLRIEVATAPDHRALDVARAVRAATGAAAPVTVLITDVAAGGDDPSMPAP